MVDFVGGEDKGVRPETDEDIVDGGVVLRYTNSNGIRSVYRPL